MKKSVLFIMPYLPGGGAEKVLIDVLRNFDYSRYDVSLFLEFRDGVYVDSIPENVSVHSMWGRLAMRHERLFRLLRMFRLYGLFHSLFCRRAISSVVKGRSFDAIVSFMEGNALKYHSYVAGNAKKNVSWVHIDLKKKHWSLDFFRDEEEERKAYDLMNSIVCVSEDVRSTFGNLYPELADRCVVIYNPIDREKIVRLSESSPKREKRKFTVCMVGRLNAQKRYDRALEVACRLKRDGYDVDFWVLGDGELLSGLKRKAKELRLDDTVLFLGFVKTPYAVMKSSDIYLSTSDAEGFSLTLCEAFCLGIPAVSTATAGPSELIAQSGGGLLAGDDVEDIYRKVRQMIDDETLRKRCSERALEYSRGFDVANAMSQIYEVLG